MNGNDTMDRWMPPKEGMESFWDEDEMLISRGCAGFPVTCALHSTIAISCGRPLPDPRLRPPWNHQPCCFAESTAEGRICDKMQLPEDPRCSGWLGRTFACQTGS